MSQHVRIGIDIGGTFTDATLVDSATGTVTIEKVLTTPSDPSLGFLEATRKVMEKANISVAEVEAIVHATTVATNSIIENKVARTAFVTTDGFRDMLELARQMRPSLYDLRFEKPPSMVERRHCFGIPERLDARGQELVPLDKEAIKETAEILRAEGIESVAICFLHSYINDTHEREAGAILAEAMPAIPISLSVDVAPEFREYYRASTTVINAAIAPEVSTYLLRIEEQLEVAGLPADLLIMQSSGGVYSSRAARGRPVYMVESGPAAGVIAANHLAGRLGYPNLLSFDMGGTTAKACLVKDGLPKVTKDFEVGAAAAPGSGSSRGSGYPVRTPVIELVEIGSGGGSIAWVDDGGALRVGPQSAGAAPGPACYGRGGENPTVTDANLVLGRLNPTYFLGGAVLLDREAALKAIERCAVALGMDIVGTANAIVEIANTAMVNALRLVSLQHGYDPREFLLVAFGGAGPVHANRLARDLGVETTLIPMSAGITSAMGLLVTDLRHEHTAAVMRRSDSVDPDRISESFGSLQERGKADLREDGISEEQMSFLRSIDMRYVGQSYELTIPVDAAGFGTADLVSATEQFHLEHDRAYGHCAPDEPVEFVNLRLTAVGEIPKPALREIPSTATDPVKEQREVFFSESGGFVLSPIYDRYLLAPGARIAGPAVIEEFDTSTVLHPGYEAEVDKYGNLFITLLTPA